MSETAHFFLIQITLLSIVLVLHTYVGLHVVRRTLIFSDLVLDQLAAFGALVGIGIGVEYGTPCSYVVSMSIVLVGALLLAVVKPGNREIPREAVIGIMYAMALVACLLLGDKLSGGEGHVAKMLVGSMLWVTWPLVGITGVIYVALLIFHYLCRHRFIALAAGESERAKLWDFLFFTTQGIITVLIVPIAGVLLAYAFLMIPAAIAAMFVRGWGRGVLLGWSVGFLACVIGVVCSYLFEWPYGPTLVLSLGAFFVMAICVRALFSEPTLC